MKTREKCGDCKHGAHPNGPCIVEEISGPPSTRPPTPDDPHPGRTVTPCECQISTPYRNGAEIV